MSAEEDSTPSGPSLLDQLGGEQVLRAVVSDFIGRVMSDVMIGFHFRSVDRVRLIEREFEFAREHLGGSGTYTGRPLRAAHGAHKILGGQFNRRLRLLDQTLHDHGAPDEVRIAWLRHNESLREQITQDQETECND